MPLHMLLPTAQGERIKLTPRRIRGVQIMAREALKVMAEQRATNG
jgi:hypothetical protein